MVEAITGAGLVVVNVAAGVGTAMYAGTAFGRRPNTVRRSVVVIMVLCALALLGAGWVAHAGAGISLAAFATVMFASPHKVVRRMVVSVLAMVAFALVGAHWVIGPMAWLIAIAIVRLFGCSRGRGLGFGASSRRMDWTAERPHRVDLRKDPVEPVPPAAAHTPSLAMYLFDDRVPAAARDKLRLISERARAASEYLTQQGRGSGIDAIEVERIRDDYAPGAVRGYLALPPWSAQGTVLADGKTGLELLIDQLDLLEHRLQEIQESVALTGGEELLTHGRFLKDRFPDRGEDDLRI
ncbi:hypothetical protein [Allobranchiibius sp. GilTou38]|uniref:hypothetical protein n=1 Tax=Allobranchiibius sp. GilTou38 TaxID=2815210 RepID=UPI001AA1C7E3|nr:hypothetical protein [Allobranchiibius sp. GilTou38]MBO1767378.1 hypothetical protein [Allobranchiibius sp. GilTou38]